MRERSKKTPPNAKDAKDSKDAKRTPLEAGAINRRAFVKKGGSLILVSAAACAEGTTPTAMGTFRLLLTGLDESATSGGAATITPTAGGNLIQVNIPAAGDQSTAAPVGTYSVAYSPPGNHQLAPGQTVPSTITITEGQTTTVAITLIAVGSLQVTVTGLTGSPANGGTASAQRTDATGTAIPINISAAGSGAAANVPAGTYTVTYTPPAGFTVSGTNPVTGLAVSIGAATPVGFAVSAVSSSVGTVHVTVNGLTGAATAGSVSARLTNNTGSTFTTNLPAPSGGTSSGDLTSLPVGSYNVTYTAPATFQLAAGQTNPQVAAVTDGGTTNVTWTAEASPVGLGIVFRSDWGTATGKGDAAIRDTSKARPWEIYIGNTSGGDATACTVIASTGLGFPTTNCLQVDCIHAGNTVQEFHTGAVSNLPGGGAWPVPGVGQSVYYRVYKRLRYPHHTSEPPPAGNNNHCLEERSGSATNWSFTFNTGPNGWNPVFNVWVSATPTRFNLGGGTPIYLARDAVYRLEWRVHRTGTSTRQHEVRIYDGAGVLIHQTADFMSGATSLLGYTAALNHTLLDAVQLGTNGMGFNPPEPTTHVIPAWYWAGLAVGNADWLGPYSASG